MYHSKNGYNGKKRQLLYLETSCIIICCCDTQFLVPTGSRMFLESFSSGQGVPLLLTGKVGEPRVASFIPTCSIHGKLEKEGLEGWTMLYHGVRDVTYSLKPIQLLSSLQRTE